jgi:hypothetical protein
VSGSVTWFVDASAKEDSGVPYLMLEVARFQEWAEGQTNRYGEWECDYPNWNALYAAVLEFVTLWPFHDWSQEELRAVMYAVARDNELHHLANEVGRYPEVLFGLAQAAAEEGERDVKWQLAVELGNHAPSDHRTENLLVRFACDNDESVRRLSLQALAKHKSRKLEELAVKEWHRSDVDQEYARIGVLWCLQHVRSSLLPPLVTDAAQDDRPYLAAFAKKLQSGELEG